MLSVVLLQSNSNGFDYKLWCYPIFPHVGCSEEGLAGSNSNVVQVHHPRSRPSPVTWATLGGGALFISISYAKQTINIAKTLTNV